MFRLVPDLQIGILLAWRTRVFLSLFWLLVTLLIVVWMAAQFSARQPATVGLDVGISFIRVALPLMMLLLVQELFSREFDRRYYLITLTYPRPRYLLYIGRFTAIYIIILLSLLCMSLLLAAQVWLLGDAYSQATPVALGSYYFVTMSFVAVDALVLTAVSILIALAATTPSFILIGTIGFMLIARSYSGIILLLQTETYVVSDANSYQSSLSVLRYFIPDLGALDIRQISLYGKIEFLPHDWFWSLISSIAYAFMLIMLSAWILHKKRLN